ncbi:uncharacterized protein DDB_G0286175-like [Hydra vulgaris]|uniref:Uncharacterized protein DDB_G0286175-like n=1 Tax=Hydra vulgaris TaxID=6087 RepID=A0ABM4D054_HYDVU
MAAKFTEDLLLQESKTKNKNNANQTQSISYLNNFESFILDLAEPQVNLRMEHSKIIMNAINNIHKRKKRADTESIYEEVLKHFENRLEKLHIKDRLNNDLADVRRQLNIKYLNFKKYNIPELALSLNSNNNKTMRNSINNFENVTNQLVSVRKNYQSDFLKYKNLSSNGVVSTSSSLSTKAVGNVKNTKNQIRKVNNDPKIINPRNNQTDEYKWPVGTTLICGDSILMGINEKKNA